MHERPIGDLVDALRALGADIRYLGEEGFPPLAIGPGHLHLDARRRDPRRDFEPVCKRAARWRCLWAEPASRSTSPASSCRGHTCEMTLSLMARFGVDVAWEGARVCGCRASDGYRSPGRIVSRRRCLVGILLSCRRRDRRRPGARARRRQRQHPGRCRFADTLAAMGALVTLGSDWIEAEGEHRCARSMPTSRTCRTRR